MADKQETVNKLFKKGKLVTPEALELLVSGRKQNFTNKLVVTEKNRAANNWLDTRILTGDVYTTYSQICAENNTTPLTQRRVSDLIGELDMLGIINAKVISKGRHGRTREIMLANNGTSVEKIKTLLAENFG